MGHLVEKKERKVENSKTVKFQEAGHSSILERFGFLSIIERKGLENRYARKCIESSNLSSSAMFILWMAYGPPIE